ncbi:MAG: hypothetical protein AB1405_06195 [Bdellovibrionota bacterium]
MRSTFLLDLPVNGPSTSKLSRLQREFAQNLPALADDLEPLVNLWREGDLRGAVQLKNLLETLGETARAFSFEEIAATSLQLAQELEGVWDPDGVEEALTAFLELLRVQTRLN